MLGICQQYGEFDQYWDGSSQTMQLPCSKPIPSNFGYVNGAFQYSKPIAYITMQMWL